MESQDQIISRFEEIIELPVEQVHDEVSDLKAAFYSMNHQKLMDQQKAFRETAEGDEEFEPTPNPLEGRFKELFNIYRDNRAKWVHQRQETQKTNLESRRSVIKEMTDLIDDEENIGKAFDRFKDLQERWTKNADIDPKHLGKLRADYKLLVDKFYYNIGINRELKEYDLAKNLELRTQIITKLEELKDETRIKDIELIVGACREQWEDAGPVKHELFSGLRERYYGASKILHKKVQDHYNARKEEMKNNLEAKQKLVAEIIEFAALDLSKGKDWKTATDRIMEIRDVWKKVGPIDRKSNDKVWDEFKEAMDSFFGQKKDFHQGLKDEFDKHKVAKEALIEKAAKLADSEEWRDTADAFKRLQNKWKEVGNAGPRHENKLWQAFRGHADSFFERRKEFFGTKDVREGDNLKAKEALLEKMGKIEMKGSKSENLAMIKELMAEWSEVGHIPKKSIDTVGKAYGQVLDDLYGKLDMAKGEMELLRFTDKLERMAAQKDGAEQLEKDERFLKRKLNDLEKEHFNLENNMAFFKNAKPDNPLLQEVQKKIAVSLANLESLRSRVKLYRKFY
ncbi:MAG: hypothetical protein ACI9YU_001522 [Flavobacteriales bacterium]|jgi:hypothetical protein